MAAVWVGFALLGALSLGTCGAPLTPFAGIYLRLLAPEYFQPLHDLAARHDTAAAEAGMDEIETRKGETRGDIMGAGQGSTGRGSPRRSVSQVWPCPGATA